MAFAISEKRSSIFLVVAAISGAAVAFVFGVFVGNTLPGPNIFSQDTLSSWVTAAATVMITVLTFILAVETWRLRAAQSAQIENLHRESIRLYAVSSGI
jgi:cytochrome bd-type quinol oxidase subunit 2